MKVWEPIKILCRQDPQTEVLATDAGFSPERGVVFKIERVYEHHPGPSFGDIHGQRHAMALTTREVFETKGRRMIKHPHSGRDFGQDYPDVGVGDLVEFTLKFMSAKGHRWLLPPIKAIYLGADHEWGFIAMWVTEVTDGWVPGLEKFSHHSIGSVKLVRTVLMG